jgi:hypothetical protein
MKNLLVVPAFVFAAVVLSGCGAQKAAETGMGGDTSVPMEEEFPRNDWMSLLGDGKSIECTLPGEGMMTKISAEGKKYRTETVIDGKKHLSVSDGDMMWTWIEGEKHGMKMEFSCMDEIRTTIPEEGGSAPEYAASPEEVIGEVPDIACSETGSVDISVPADVVFSDQCALIRTQLQAMEQLKNQMPQGMPELPDDVKQMMGR